MKLQLKRNRSYWEKEEDVKLFQEVSMNPKQTWCSVARNAGLNRSGNACRLRWINHLKPGNRPGRLTDEEKLLILEFRSLFGKNCWAKIATHLPGRRDNDIKNFWHTMAKRANGDVDSKAEAMKAELVKKITSARKLTMDWLISNDATLLPGLALEAASWNAAGGAIAGGGAVAASFSTAVYIGGADAAYSADVGAAMEFSNNPFRDSHISPYDNVVLQQQMMGTARGPQQTDWGALCSVYDGDQAAAIGFNAAAARWDGSNDIGNPHNSYAGVDCGVYQWVPA